MGKPNLLLCFDAFGTLFKPKRPITVQYAEIARQCGITSFDNEELNSSFKAAFKDESRVNPNYGKASGLGATRWWTNVIHKTFAPLVKMGEPLPRDLAPKLLHRFSSREGYDVAPTLVASLQNLKQAKEKNRYNKLVIGVITNSDDRVPGILSSFGLTVSPRRFGANENDAVVADWQQSNIDFHCMSYDVGVEKPDALIFRAAETMLADVVALHQGQSLAEAKADVECTWQKVYVGDDFAKDVAGATNAGWNAFLLDADSHAEHELADVIQMPYLHESPSQPLDQLLTSHKSMRLRSVQDLVNWLTDG